MKPGPVTFQVKNAGTIEHNFVIQGTAVKLEGLQPGQTKSATVALKPGQYTMECTIPGHAEAGMVGTITVAP